MGKGRLEAFSDGVIAIIITIMVLELKTPSGSGLDALRPLAPLFFSYVLSFIYVGIYWNNHHHLLHAVSRVSGPILWANLHLLFWLSLIPFVTAWSGATNFAPVPVACYGFVLVMAGAAYYLLTGALIRRHGQDSDLARAVGRDSKTIVSVALYAAAIPCALYWNVLPAFALYAAVAAMWIVPDRRIEDALARHGAP